MISCNVVRQRRVSGCFRVSLASKFVVSLPCTPLSLVERLRASAVMLRVIGLFAGTREDGLVIVARMEEVLYATG